MPWWLVAIIGVCVLTLLILFFLSFGTLEYVEIGLNYSWISETIEKKPYSNGRYYLGIGNHFIKFPRMVVSIAFLDDGTQTAHGPALQSRTKDGLNVQLEVSFQYRLILDDLYDMYTTLGGTYEQTFVRMAIEQLTTSATQHNAHFFFTNRTVISQEMHKKLAKHFKEHAFAEVPFFQLRTVHLPKEFEEAIKETQVRQQEIQIASLEQKTKRVTFETKIIKAKKAVEVLANQASGEAQAILIANDAYCNQYLYTQELQSESLRKIMGSAGWSTKQLLEYMRIRAMRDHPSDKTTIRL